MPLHINKILSSDTFYTLCNKYSILVYLTIYEHLITFYKIVKINTVERYILSKILNIVDKIDLFTQSYFPRFVEDSILARFFKIFQNHDMVSGRYLLL